MLNQPDTSSNPTVNDAKQLSPIELLSVADRLNAAQMHDEVIALYQNWLKDTQSPLAYAVHFNLGVALGNRGDSQGAEQAYLNALHQNAMFAQAYLNLGTQLERQGRMEEAISQWRRMVSVILPENSESLDFVVMALNNIGRLLELLKRFAEAETALQQSLMLKPDQPDALLHWVHLRQKQCAWPVYKPFGNISISDMIKSTSALAMLGLTNDPGLQLITAMKFAADKVARNLPALSPPNGYKHDKIRIGYLSSDFCAHAVSILTVELFELHDRNQFEVYGFCWSREDGSELRARVVKAFDHYIPIGSLSDADAAQCIRDHEIDILVDLHGLTSGTRPNIIANRPAPLQMTYLGFPGPTALPGIDFVIADEFVLPERLQPFFTEKPLYLPGSFQINDRHRAIGPKPTRASCDLPDDAFVFCAFNSNHKITPEVFATWMRILGRVSDSVLWIVSDSPEVRANLANEAKSLGIDPARLVYAERVAPADYLARYQVADLFLDTFPFNAGTTASDALWAGLPVLTCSGNTFASRMAGSLLRAVGLSELITDDLQAYEEMACNLANERSHLDLFKHALTANRMSSPLFDTPSKVRQLENALKEKLT